MFRNGKLDDGNGSPRRSGQCGPCLLGRMVFTATDIWISSETNRQVASLSISEPLCW